MGAASFFLLISPPISSTRIGVRLNSDHAMQGNLLTTGPIPTELFPFSSARTRNLCLRVEGSQPFHRNPCWLRAVFGRSRSCGSIDDDQPPTRNTLDSFNQNKKIELKDAILSARISKNLSQDQLAQKIKVDTLIIEDYEDGTAIPDQKMISQLEEALGVKFQ